VIAAMLNLDKMARSILIVVLEDNNLDRMKKADAVTLESILNGGVLPPPRYPLNLNVLIAYEPDEVELYKRSQGDPWELLEWLERGREFIKGVDGTENSFSMNQGKVTR